MGECYNYTSIPCSEKSAVPSVPDQVSWQSAFWGLIPIALNSMAQPCGRVCDSPTGIGHLLRISPVMCLLDATIVIMRTMVYRFTNGSFKAANRRIVIQRYTEEPEDDSSGTFKDFRENTYTRWVIFAFSVPQIVKLFAFQGVLVTQICAGMFLGSFVVVELLVVLPKAYHFPKALKEKEVVKGSGFDSLPYLTIATSVCFLLYTVIQALVSISKDSGLALDTLQSTGLTILFCGSLAFIPSGLHSNFLKLRTRVSAQVATGTTHLNDAEIPSVKARRRLLGLENILLLLILAVPAAYWLLSHLISVAPKNQHPIGSTTGHIVAPIMIGIWATLCLLWASITFKAVIASGRATTRRVEIILSGYFWSLHIIAAVLYYRYVFDPRETVKPAWTEQLG